MTVPATRWWLVRHAPIQGPGDVLYGQLDAEADCSDRAGFDALAARLPAGAVWLVSPLRRCRRTADALLARLPEPRPEPIPLADLAEQHFGAWQGQTHAGLAERDPDAVRRFWADPAGNRPPGGESFAELSARVARILAERSQAHAGRDVVAVCHAGPIRAALAAALGLSPAGALSFAVDPLSLTRLDHVPGEDGTPGWRIGAVNLPAR